jgi:hypothetical protein
MARYEVREGMHDPRSGEVHYRFWDSFDDVKLAEVALRCLKYGQLVEVKVLKTKAPKVPNAEG